MLFNCLLGLGAYLHDSCYPRLLAVAVIEESQLTLFHLPHEVACLQANIGIKNSDCTWLDNEARPRE